MPPSGILERYVMVLIWRFASPKEDSTWEKNLRFLHTPAVRKQFRVCALLPTHAMNGLSLEKGSGFQLNYLLFVEPGFFGKDEGSL